MYLNQKHYISIGSGDSRLVLGQIPMGHEALRRFQWGVGWVEGWGCPLTETSGHRCVPTGHDSARLTPPPRDSAFLGAPLPIQASSSGSPSLLIPSWRDLKLAVDISVVTSLSSFLCTQPDLNHPFSLLQQQCVAKDLHGRPQGVCFELTVIKMINCQFGIFKFDLSAIPFHRK